MPAGSGRDFGVTFASSEVPLGGRLWSHSIVLLVRDKSFVVPLTQGPSEKSAFRLYSSVSTHGKTSGVPIGSVSSTEVEMKTTHHVIQRNLTLRVLMTDAIR